MPHRSDVRLHNKGRLEVKNCAIYRGTCSTLSQMTSRYIVWRRDRRKLKQPAGLFPLYTPCFYRPRIRRVTGKQRFVNEIALTAGIHGTTPNLGPSGLQRVSETRPVYGTPTAIVIYARLKLIIRLNKSKGSAR